MEQKILDRMKKLLAMSQDTSSEQEAMIATKRLHALLSKHGMSLVELEEPVEETGEDGFLYSNRPYSKVIANAIAKLYYCQLYLMTGGGIQRKKAMFMLVGKPHHRLAARTIIENVCRVIEREAVASSRREYGGRNTRHINSFRNGAAGRIAQRCKELIAAARAGELVDDDTGETLPALASMYDTEQRLIEEWLANNVGDLKTGRTGRTAQDAAGVAAGRRAADKVSLHQGIAKTAPKLIK